MVLRFRGSAMFRQRIICSTLSGKNIVITDIRANDEEPGLRDYEANFLRLMDKLCNGAKLKISSTGTSVWYKPGVILGGKGLKHDCGLSRGIGYCLEALVMLGPFAKKPIQNMVLTGITNNNEDMTVDMIRTVLLPMMKQFGVGEGLELKISQRGAAPKGGGKVVFTCPIVTKLTPVDLNDFGRVKRIRGIAYATRVSPQMSNRVVDASRSILTKFLPDVYLYTDQYKGTESGLSPGFGLSLVAESTTGALYSGEYMAEGTEMPEDVGKRASMALLQEIQRGGFVDTLCQSMMLLFMVVCPEDVSRIRLGKLSRYTVLHLRQLKDFFGVQFNVKADKETGSVVMSCVGVGYVNLAKKIW
eukprot:TRINITY_DN1049_c0_g1_i1.p1 TRINITY_DN1049_c0_g1~~TRINITY_DN1049_c0_g1_i1.p1  ORF type:complete len:379 (-),score=97.12 TRINITY_DN1049_c0_g1_i1:1157-2233(-)